MATSDLQNSYGPEMAHAGGHDLPQAVVGGGLEATHPGQQYGAALAPPYHEQHAKNNQYNGTAPIQPNFTEKKRRVLGLPVALFWGIVIGLVIILALGLGVGLGVGLSQRNSSGDSSGGSAATATTSASAGADITSTTSATPSSTTARSSTTTSTTTSATSAAATARNVEICNQASLVTDCTNITVPVNTCGMFPDSSGSLTVSCSYLNADKRYYLIISGLSNSIQR